MGGASVHRKIGWEVKDEIGFLRLIDPPENRMDTQFFRELHDLTSIHIPESKIKALIVSGSGRHFSSGANLEQLFHEIKNGKTPNKRDILSINYHSLKYLNELPIPVIAAIKGVCIGSALELAMHCHFRMCTRDAVFGLPETSFGLIPGLGGIPGLLELTGKAKALELVLKGNTFSATDALNRGIVDAIYSKKELFNKAEQLAKLASQDYRKYNKSDYLNTLNSLG